MRPQTIVRVGHARPVGAGADRRRLRRAGDPPDRPHRPAGRDPPGRGPGRRPARRGARRPRKGYRSLVTPLTKRMAEDLTEYLHEQGVKVRYMHSDVDTLERIEIIRDLRLGAFDVLVGINLSARGARHSRMRPGRHPRCRQGGLPALGDLADPDDRPRGAQRRRPGDPLCRHHHRLAWSARWPRPNGAAPSSRPITRSTASRPQTIRRDMHDIVAHIRVRKTAWWSIRVLRNATTSSATTCAPYRGAGKADARGGRQPRIRGSRRACATRSAGWKRANSACPKASARLRSSAAATRASRAPERRGSARRATSGWGVSLDIRA
ncbi:MAG: hypothetical protein KatS3mg120_2227 [Erythrobacter sp.]|nr:MAG: hypothetical protein KatS3mg120_2227 [Erythrobacter sp.]